MDFTGSLEVGTQVSSLCVCVDVGGRGDGVHGMMGLYGGARKCGMIMSFFSRQWIILGIFTSSVVFRCDFKEMGPCRYGTRPWTRIRRDDKKHNLFRELIFILNSGYVLPCASSELRIGASPASASGQERCALYRQIRRKVEEDPPASAFFYCFSRIGRDSLYP
ncbi:hypothetical protein KP509_18G045700 [Ceratopteris richardii]|uniref:Uncharacterized protein n=1 Tax=Ceratopteris richardii TaxID=49495 RepID=A0A8T2ST14_CERRI|nr:hypothetical protein KP509_18G045700 [Ceratopteris richardii]